MERIVHLACPALLFLCLPRECEAQVPAEPTWGIDCLWEEAEYLDTLSYNTYFPPSMTTVTITDVGEYACRPNGVDSLDIYGGAIPFTPTGEVVTRRPMVKTIYRDLVFTNTQTGLEVATQQRIRAVELLPYNDDPLTVPYVYLGNGTIDYAAIHTALAGDAGPDFHDACGNDFTLSAFNAGGQPAILDTYPWGTGSRVVCYWHCQGSAGSNWYIQHVLINDAPFVLPCEPPNNEVIDLSGCDQDFTAPFLLGLDPLFLYCAEVPPVQYPQVTDDYDTAVEVQYLGDEVFGDCYTEVYRTFGASDACGNTAIQIQEIDISNEAFISFPVPPEDAEIAADAVLTPPEEIPIASSCGPVFFAGYWPTYAGNAVTIELSAEAPCSNGASTVYTLTATTVEFFNGLPAQLTIELGEEPPPPADLAALNANNPFFYFTLEEDTTYSEPPMECPLYTINRTYQTFNGADELLEALNFVQHIAVNGDCTVGMDGASAAGASVFPNPSNGQFRIGNAKLPLRYIVVDGRGRMVESGTITDANSVVDLGQDVVPGVYQLVLDSGGSVTHHRLTVIGTL